MLFLRFFCFVGNKVTPKVVKLIMKNPVRSFKLEICNLFIVDVNIDALISFRTSFDYFVSSYIGIISSSSFCCVSICVLYEKILKQCWCSTLLWSFLTHYFKFDMDKQSNLWMYSLSFPLQSDESSIKIESNLWSVGKLVWTAFKRNQKIWKRNINQMIW